MQTKNTFSKGVHIWKMISILYSYFPQLCSVPELNWQDKGNCEKIKGYCVIHGNRDTMFHLVKEKDGIVGRRLWGVFYSQVGLGGSVYYCPAFFGSFTFVLWSFCEKQAPMKKKKKKSQCLFFTFLWCDETVHQYKDLYRRTFQGMF